jgi:fumarate hydratase subunit beta
MRTIVSPLKESDVRSLKLGEVVAITGPMITGRDEMHMRALELARAGEPLPDGIEGSVLFHCGPIMVERNGGWQVIAAGPTTSARMNTLEAEMIRRFSIRAIVGKGGMSAEVSEAMRETGCVYLAATGGAAVSLAEGLNRVTGVEWQDLGMAEAMWKLSAEKFGPLIVAMDAEGNSLYEDVRSSLKR